MLKTRATQDRLAERLDARINGGRLPAGAYGRTRAGRARTEASAYLARRRAELIDDVSRRWADDWRDEQLAG